MERCGVPTPVLYLDFDGVLNSDAWFQNHRPSGCLEEVIDPVLAARVQCIVEATGCRIVVCSTRRLHHGEGRLASALGAFHIPMHGCTPPTHQDRRVEAILAHAAELPPGTRWVVLDDMVGPNHVEGAGGYAVTPDDGVTEADAARVIELLTGSPQPVTRTFETSEEEFRRFMGFLSTFVGPAQ